MSLNFGLDVTPAFSDSDVSGVDVLDGALISADSKLARTSIVKKSSLLIMQGNNEKKYTEHKRSKTYSL